MKKMRYGILYSFCLVAGCALAAGCGDTGQAEAGTILEQEMIDKSDVTESTVEEASGAGAVDEAEQNAEKALTQLTPEQLDAYQQMTLYIQEGFRTYHIEDTYQAYFQEMENLDDGTCECSILLEGQGSDELWYEQIACSYDAENEWYRFEGVFEPIFVDAFYDGLDEDSDFVKNVRENYVYTTEISKKQDFALPIHYDSENGPVEHDTWKIPPDSEWIGRYVRTYLYTYNDDRMDLDIIIEYPQVSLKDDALEEEINTKLKNAVFFPYGYEEGESVWNPRDKAYADITRNYVITREDENYFSMRIFEDNYYRGANHPNQFERGFTINMKTGEVLRLQDVVGENQTPLSLLDTGAFRCLWSWKDGNESDEETSENWMNQLHSSFESDLYAELASFDSCFYLTQDGLGLITEISRYYTPIEASFADLGFTPEIFTGDKV